MAESVLLSIAGGIVGVAAVLAVLAFGNLSITAEGVTIAFSPSIRLVVVGLGVAVVAAALAGIAPAIRSARAEIVPALRQR